jgi:hypothetical protein
VDSRVSLAASAKGACTATMREREAPPFDNRRDRLLKSSAKTMS